MSDGQDKSDDLIAELAKLMASSAGSAEPEAKPGPKLVSTPETDATEPRPAAPVIRIPGMDAPVAAAPSPVPVVPAAPAPGAAPQAASPAPTIRIPGMDQPVAAAPRPVSPSLGSVASEPKSPAPELAEPKLTEPRLAADPSPAEPRPAEVKPVEHRAPAIDFGTLPPAATIRPEPLSNWQDREIPKPVGARPAVAAEPVLTPPAPKAVAPAATPVPPASAFGSAPASVVPPVAVPAKLDEDEPEAEPETQAEAHEEPVIAGKPAPADDSFDFDFGFDQNPPGPAVEEPPAAADATRSAAPSPAASTGDPIADLIAAELDAAEEKEPAPLPARPPVQAPTVRSFPAASAQPQVQAQPQQQRSVTTNPVRPPVAPAVAQAQPKPAVPEAPAEPDRFDTAPVFGVAAKPAAPASAAAAPAERDPMDEIESLIGEAVRVELSAPEKPAVAPERPKAAPVVPPLTTGFAPRRAALKDTEPQVTSAEAAILAAAAATGADVGNLDGTMAAETPASPYKRPKTKAKAEKRPVMSGGMRQYVGMAVAGTLLLAAGFGLYWVLGMGRAPDTEAPVLQADATPAKEPAPVVAPKQDQEGSVVFGSTDGSAAETPEQIVPRDASLDTSVADVAEPVGTDGAPAALASNETGSGESELANRKVRTVTVRPDGTIVSGDDAVAGSAALPVDRPNVPEIPGAEVEPSPLLAETAASDAPVDTTTLALAAPETPTPATDPLAQTLANVDPSIVPPVPMARPVDRSRLNGGANQRVAASNGPVDLTGGVTQPAATPAVSNRGGSYVQLSSQPTSADAQSSLRTTQNRLSSILNGRSLEIRQVDLGAKGVWYRVVLPTSSFSEATQTCASLKANGVQCVPING